MENQSDTTNKAPNPGIGPAIQSFKLPQNYLKLKKQIFDNSSRSRGANFLSEKSRACDDSIEFCRQLLNYPGFESFRTAHFFIHEKGKSFATKHEITSSSLSSKDFHVNEFNQLFQAIKKSKNRTFGQEALKGFDFDILGTFLAREFALGNHNIILVISRNDFLSQTKTEKSSFSELASVIGPYFEIILDKELQIQQFRHIKLAYDNLPYKVVEVAGDSNEHKKLPSGKYFELEALESLDKADIFHQERIGLLGELLNTLKHELSNPLFGLQLSAEILCQEIEEPESRQFMQEIASSIKRSQSIISNFTEFYTTSDSLSAKDIEKMVKEVFTLTKSQSRNIIKSFELIGPCDENFLLKANSVWLAQILFNLVVNSAQALNNHGGAVPQIIVKAKLRHPFELHVIDNGPGADASAVEKIFRPFYTTKEKGTGLGLAISQSLAAKLGGNIEYIAQGQGAHFVLRLAP